MAIKREEIIRRLRKNISEENLLLVQVLELESVQNLKSRRNRFSVVYNSGRYRMAGRGSSAGLFSLW